MMSTRLRGISVFFIFFLYCVLSNNPKWEGIPLHNDTAHSECTRPTRRKAMWCRGPTRKIVWQNNAKYLHITNLYIDVRLASMLYWRLIVLCRRWLKTQFHNHAQWAQVKWNCAENLATGSRILKARQSSILNIRNTEKETIIQYIINQIHHWK